MIDKVEAPFTDDQIASLNAYQNGGVFLPFTCGNDSCPKSRNGERVLKADKSGWHCPHCSYHQTWAHKFMADWSWKELTHSSKPFPTIVCLCGSTRFYDAFKQANLRETIAGKIVLSIGCDFKSDDALGLTDEDKVRLDELHKRKIDLADEILVLNVGKYVGQSTKSEIEYAVNHGKHIRYLEPDDPETGWCLL